mmetsp:Transcript_22001/g.54366  ORF Transcript_22001/g.54366 Transcript_22001/m.54366 type:complete len:494 (-) Transcript_22001:1258-2739(-)
MASSIQHPDHTNWSCLPCIGKEESQPGGNRSTLTSNQRNTSSDGQAVMQHCVGEDLQETPEMLQKSLADFEQAIQKERNAVYEMALNQNREYVEDPTFRLKFLRANVHNVGKSVRQMLSFLQYKAKYFGKDKVAREITLDDLNEEDKRLLWSGLYHIQEERDRTGRTIIHWFGSLLGRFRAENVIRVTYIVWINIMLPDPVVQMKGLASVYHNTSRTGEEFVMPGMDFVLTVTNVTNSFPIRYSVMHFCLQSGEGNLVLNNSLLGSVLTDLPLYTKVRSRIHVGSIIELQYELRSHGIPMDTFPVDINGNIRENVLNAWLYKYQREQGEGNKLSPHTGDGNEPRLAEGNKIIPAAWNQQLLLLDNTQSLDHMWPVVAGENNNLQLPLAAAPTPFAQALSVKPTENDVLLGRGRFTQSWPGNIKFREYLENQSEDYDKVPRKDRQKRAIELTHELIANGVRFFEQNAAGVWEEAEFTTSMKKVSQLFRSIRKKK